MARDWRRAALAAFAALTLMGPCTGPCALGAQATDEDNEEEAAKTPADASHPTKSGAKKRQDPLEAQQAVEAAAKQLHAGRATQAVQAMTTTLAGGNLPPGIMAKALYVRGAAYRQLRQPAQAISDLTSALWLKGGLGGEDRDEALRERAAAYADAGLRDSEAPDASKASKSAGGGNWLSGLFGGTPSASPPPAPSRPRAEPAPAPARASTETGSSWTSATQVQPSRPALATAPPAAPHHRAAPPPVADSAPRGGLDGKYLVQLAAVRTEAEARALAARAKREQASVLASRKSQIDRAVVGNMGVFYRVRFGPFVSAQESQAACAKLQGGGFDCMPVTP